MKTKRIKEKPVGELFVLDGKLYGRNLSKRIKGPVYWFDVVNKKWIKLSAEEARNIDARHY